MLFLVLFSKNGNSAPTPLAKEAVATDSQRRQKKAQAMKAPQPIFGSQFQAVNQPRKPYQWLIDSGLIEIEAMTFIRGRSIGHAFMIVDEAQNMTDMELNSVMTRIGKNSKIIFCGDFRQTDLCKRNDMSGLKKFIAIVDHMTTFRHVEFDVNDIVRSALVKEYIIARMHYEDVLIAS